MIERPEVVDWSTSMHHDDQCPFSSKEIDQELEESVYCESLGKLAPADPYKGNYYLVDITDWIHPHCNIQRHDTTPRRY